MWPVDIPVTNSGLGLVGEIHRLCYLENIPRRCTRRDVVNSLSSREVDCFKQRNRRVTESRCLVLRNRFRLAVSRAEGRDHDGGAGG